VKRLCLSVLLIASALLNASSLANPLGKAVIIKDPKTGQPFPNKQIPTSRFEPAHELQDVLAVQ
jgi:hypothetical protein